MTNYDKIKNLTKDELIQLLIRDDYCCVCMNGKNKYCNRRCEEGIRGWLDKNYRLNNFNKLFKTK